MQRHRGFVEGVRNPAVGLGIFFRLQLGFRPLPDRARRIDLLGFAFRVHEFDREQNVIRVGRDDAPDLVRFEIFFRVLFQMQHDFRAAGNSCRLRFARRERYRNRRRPEEVQSPRLFRIRRGGSRPRCFRDHESRIEADAELADQARAVLGLGELGA